MEEPISKSQKKREAERMQALGVKLIPLSLAELDSLPISEVLKNAVLSAKKIKSNGALRRQMQLIGKIMRTECHEAIAQAYEALRQIPVHETQTFHAAEVWRSRLIQQGESALLAFLNEYPQTDTKALRRLIEKAKLEQEKTQVKHAYRALFRFLTQSMYTSPH